MFDELLQKVQFMKDKLQSGTADWRPTLCLL
jgi:hypothetical protein